MKHHQHTVYGGKIETLRKELTTKIEWAIRESQKIQSISQKPPYEISSGGIYFPSGFSSEVAPVALTIPADDGLNELSIIVRNSSGEMSGDARYVYLFTDNSSVFDVEVRGQRGLTYSPKFQIADPSDSPDGLSRQYRRQTKYLHSLLVRQRC